MSGSVRCAQDERPSFISPRVVMLAFVSAILVALLIGAVSHLQMG